MSTIYMDIHNMSPNIEMYDFENIIQKYATSAGASEKDRAKYFPQLWMPFAWAATIGFVEDLHKPLEGTTKKDTFKYSTINNNGERIFQSLILFTVAKKGYEILSDAKEVNKTIEEYANGGFEIIYEKIKEDQTYFNSPTDYIEFIVDWMGLDNN